MSSEIETPGYVSHDLPQAHRLVPQGQASLANPSDVQQLVDELRKAAVLALDDGQHVRQGLRSDLPFSDRLGGEVNRRDRTAKLVRRHREKLVAGAQRLLGSSIQPGVVQRQGGAAGQLLRHLDVGGLISAVRGGAERDCPLQAPFHEQGNAEVGDRSDLVDQRLPGEDAGVQLGRDRRPGVSGDGHQAPRSGRAEHVDGAPLSHVRNGYPRDAVQCLLDLQRGEEAGGVREKQRAVQQPFSLGDVAEAPDSADHGIPDPLGHRIAFEDPAVAAANLTGILRFGLGVDRFDLPDELVGTFQLAAD